MFLPLHLLQSLLLSCQKAWRCCSCAAHLAAGVNKLAIAHVHEVEVALPDLNVVLLAAQVLLLLQHLPHILDDELPCLDRLLSKQAKPLGPSTPLQQDSSRQLLRERLTPDA